MLNPLLEKFYNLNLSQRLLAINLSALGALLLIASRYAYRHYLETPQAPLIFVGIGITAVAVFLLLLRFLLLLKQFNPEHFIDNKDYATGICILLGYSGAFIVKYALGSEFDEEALALSFMLAVQAPQLNRFSPLIAIPFIVFISLAYSASVAMPSSIYVFFFVLMQQLTVWGFGIGVMMELRARVRSQGLAAELKSTQELLEHTTKRNERMRLGREIHDAMGHNLAALNINLQVCEQMADDALKQPIRMCQNASDQLYQQLRDIVDELKHDQGFDLQNNVARLIDDTPRLNIAFDCEEGLSLSEEYANCLLRIIQEAITNTLKHSDAQRMDIQLSLAFDTTQKAELTLNIVDYGSKAIALETLQHNNGLQGMQERIQDFNGQLVFGSAYSGGFTVHITLPYESER